MILRFKKPEKPQEYEKCIGCIELSDKVMAYLIPYKMEGIESLYIHFSIQDGQPINVNTIPEQRYSIPVKSRFDSIGWSIDHFDGKTCQGDFYLIFLFE